ncbi:hypothetical protein AGMMS49974_10620 [Deltaproteobacteria bacterium]|nr:hypothetical protein AGMMS49974_10620 [Deltaproteobacteria bacterium]
MYPLQFVADVHDRPAYRDKGKALPAIEQITAVVIEAEQESCGKRRHNSRRPEDDGIPPAKWPPKKMPPDIARNFGERTGAGTVFA